MTPQDRERLGGDLEAAWQRLGTAGMWRELRGCTYEQAVCEVAQLLGFLRPEDRDWLLGEFGLSVDVELAMEQAIEDGHLVLNEQLREVYWAGEQIEIDWYRHSVLWDFFWQLCRYGKAGKPVDRFAFGEHAHRDIVANQKSRLLKIEAFPTEIGVLVEPVARGSQQLHLEPFRIRVFEMSGLDDLVEWHP
ncbi:MAG: hypothetical protein DWQ31_04155 [Planctomycetota bacterium]|nr:MAG: hypothetical protein DWQ31_04155 [Planctomycetota bacterium]REJ88286.1 MAG: hypothetical protein DWQ35_20125 [Planctomycetota bacterium]REK26632.1 MAG: hypothetical protein DWQ42_08390 [Planctomycetota bacterium]REK44607.1 MAG: hypothetical protein DWQ46_09050 [Planctomycetota bacterium]